MLNIEQFMREQKATAEDFASARGELYQLGIKSSYDENRIIFTTLPRYRHTFNNSYAQEANGLILELGTWKPLMVPPRALRLNINSPVANKYLHSGLYHVYKVQDGTSFNIYFYSGKWCIATSGGYEMNNMKWDNKTYKELIEECLANFNLTWKDFTATLDTKTCYSFGFKHPEFHRFYGRNQKEKYLLWFIQSVCLDESKNNFLWVNENNPLDTIPKQKVYTRELLNIRELYGQSSRALNEYLTTDTEPCYGFILRSVNFSTTKGDSDLLVESSLMRKIRNIWYDTKLIKFCHANKQYEKEQVITLNAYLSADLYQCFLQLFPQYQETFATYNKKITELANEIINLTEPGDTSVHCLANNFKQLTGIDLQDEQYDEQTKIRILMEFLINKENLTLLLQYLNE